MVDCFKTQRALVLTILWIVVVLSVQGCRNSGNKRDSLPLAAQIHQSAGDVSAALETFFPGEHTTDTLSTHGYMLRLYQTTEYEPLWLHSADGILLADLLLKDLDTLWAEGLDTGSYKLSELHRLRTIIETSGTSPADVAAFDTACSYAYFRASRDLLLGQSSPRHADTLWFHTNDTGWHAPALLQLTAEKGQYTSLDSFRSRWEQYPLLCSTYVHYSRLAGDTLFTFYRDRLQFGANDSALSYLLHTEMPWLEPADYDTLPALRQSLRGYQLYAGLPATAAMDSATWKVLKKSPAEKKDIVKINLERLRWVARLPEPAYVLVNIPLMEMSLVRDNITDFHCRVVVGRPSRQTPVLNANMTSIVFNPAWGVPPTIFRKDVAEGIRKKGSAYLEEKELVAYNKKGERVEQTQVNASNFEQFSYRQPPGDNNSLGVVKFNLPNKWDIYLHDTPHKEDFPNRNRAKSSGCIRLSRPKELAEHILTIVEGKMDFFDYEIDTIVATRRTKFVQLQHPIPVHIVYLTVFPDSTGNQVRFLSDIYRRDPQMIHKINDGYHKY